MTNEELITTDEVRKIFLRNGFTIKEGQTDLKDYVYEAAIDLTLTVAISAFEKFDNALLRGMPTGEDLVKLKRAAPDFIEGIMTVHEAIEEMLKELKEVHNNFQKEAQK